VLFCLNCQKPTPRDPILAVSPQLPSCIFQNCCLRRETTKRKNKEKEKGPIQHQFSISFHLLTSRRP
jgi:hypothetical protein